jgi:Calcineurin-like phosphoesterase superfamily domain
VRIGLISDTHIPVAAKHLWPQVYEAFRGVDLIMHGGDLMVTDVIDWLEEIAPVLAVEVKRRLHGFEPLRPPDRSPTLGSEGALAERRGWFAARWAEQLV